MRRCRLRPVWLVPAAGVALLLSGCSGSSSSAPRNVASPAPSITVPGLINSAAPVPAAYLATADAYCQTQVARLQARGPAPVSPSDPNKLTTGQLRAAASYLQQGATIEQAAAAKLAAYPVPTAGADQWRIYLQSVQLYASGVQVEATTARTGTPQQFLQDAQRLQDLRRRVLQSGASAGFGAGTACARLF